MEYIDTLDTDIHEEEGRLLEEETNESIEL